MFRIQNHLRYVSFLLSLVLIITAGSCAVLQSHLERGKYYLDKKRYAKAVYELEKAASEESTINYYIDTYSYLGQAYAGSGEPVKALSIYRNALQIVQLRLREITARRSELRRRLNFDSGSRESVLKEEDIRLADEEWQLREHGDSLKERISGLADAL